MAQTQLDAPHGAHRTDVVVSNGSSISTSAVRVTYDTTNCPSREAFLHALEAIRQAVISSPKWPLQ